LHGPVVGDRKQALRHVQPFNATEKACPYQVPQRTRTSASQRPRPRPGVEPFADDVDLSGTTALFVNEPTLLPVLMPLAPAATLLARFPPQLAAVLAAHGTPGAVIDEEQRQMRDRRLAKTSNRSVVGIMNEFTFLAEAYRGDTPGPDLLALALRLATTPAALSTAST
jgi:hypothetical protein